MTNKQPIENSEVPPTSPKSSAFKMPTPEDTVDRMKREILIDIQKLLIPPLVSSFGELADHVDANEYGGFCTDELADGMIAHFGGRDEHEGMPDGMLSFMNSAQDSISEWLASGALLRRTMTYEEFSVRVRAQLKDMPEDVGLVLGTSAYFVIDGNILAVEDGKCFPRDAHQCDASAWKEPGCFEGESSSQAFKVSLTDPIFITTMGSSGLVGLPSKPGVHHTDESDSTLGDITLQNQAPVQTVALTQVDALIEQAKAVANFQRTGLSRFADEIARLAKISKVEIGPHGELLPVLNATYVTDICTENAGGGSMVDFLTLKDSRVIGLNDESINVYSSKEAFYDGSVDPLHSIWIEPGYKYGQRFVATKPLRRDEVFADAPEPLGRHWRNLCTMENHLGDLLLSKPLGTVAIVDKEAWYLREVGDYLELHHANFNNDVLIDAQTRFETGLEWVDIDEEGLLYIQEQLQKAISSFENGLKTKFVDPAILQGV